MCVGGGATQARRRRLLFRGSHRPGQRSAHSIRCRYCRQRSVLLAVAPCRGEGDASAGSTATRADSSSAYVHCTRMHVGDPGHFVSLCRCVLWDRPVYTSRFHASTPRVWSIGRMGELSLRFFAVWMSMKHGRIHTYIFRRRAASVIQNHPQKMYIARRHTM